ncbi:MAG: YybH family protein [Thermoguttaceae bacterium]
MCCTRFMPVACFPLAAIATALAFGLAAGAAEPAPQRSPEENAVRAAVELYVAAFNRGDAKALAALWSPEAVYTNPITAQQVVGRAEIEKQFAGIFADLKGAQLQAQTQSVQMISPNVALERGSATVTAAGQPPEQSDYSAVYVKRDGQWLLDRVTEEDITQPPSHYEQLRDLEWMIGTWVDQDEQARIETTCQWTKNRNFITRSFVVSIGDRIDMAGMQIVGWDPAAKKIRSWVFDSDGAFGEGVWSKKGNRWYIQSTGTLPDGSNSSSTNVMTCVDENTFTWQSINRQAAGELLPNVDEVVVLRQTAE